MAKSKSKHAEPAKVGKESGMSFGAIDMKAFDPALASLFASSLGPVQPPPKSRYQDLPEQKSTDDSSDGEQDEDEEGEESDSESLSDEEMGEDDPEEKDLEENDAELSSDAPSDDDDVLAKLQESVMNSDRPNKKRKRGEKEEELEDTYMRKLAREEIKDEEKRKKKQKKEKEEESEAMDDSDDTPKRQKVDDESDEEIFTIPKHETQLASTIDTDIEAEKATRTVFLGNVSSSAITSKSAHKTLMRHLASFIPDLADHSPPHKVESLRFRSTAFASALPKKAAFAKKEIMDATTKSTNAYAVYATQLAAREAVKRLNGSVVLDRHLRVDSIAHPMKQDHRRCVFVGNLGFVDDESNTPNEDGSQKKPKPPSDVEEGLWVHFSKAGKVESVRVVRDPKTRVGKGIAYVQFEDGNAVEAALQYNEQRFPPLLPRKLRVVRAKGMKRKLDKKPVVPLTAIGKRHLAKAASGVYNAKVSDEQKSRLGRARAQLGKAGAFKSAESFVFEGHRASSKQGKSGLKLGGKKKSGGKPKTRSSKRGAAWKAGGGRK